MLNINLSPMKMYNGLSKLTSFNYMEYSNIIENVNLILSKIFVQKVLSDYYVCRMYSNALQITFIMEASTMNPEQTAPKGAVCSGLIVFAI